MSQRIGIDLVFIPKFAEKAKDAGLLQRLFTDAELRGAGGSAETLAGMCAAKEAYFKAVRQVPDWHEVEIVHTEDGSPEIRLQDSAYVRDMPERDVPHSSASVSISHDGEYAAAVVMISGQ